MLPQSFFLSFCLDFFFPDVESLRLLFGSCWVAALSNIVVVVVVFFNIEFFNRDFDKTELQVPVSDTEI